MRTELVKANLMYSGTAGLEIFDTIDDMTQEFLADVSRVLPEVGQRVVEKRSEIDEDFQRLQDRVANLEVIESRRKWSRSWDISAIYGSVFDSVWGLGWDVEDNGIYRYDGAGTGVLLGYNFPLKRNLGLSLELGPTISDLNAAYIDPFVDIPLFLGPQLEFNMLNSDIYLAALMQLRFGTSTTFYSYIDSSEVRRGPFLDNKALRDFLYRVAEEMSGFFPMVEPIIVGSDQARRTRELVRQVGYRDSLASAWEINLWASGLMRMGDFENGFFLAVPQITPLTLEVSRYFSSGIALALGLYFQETDDFGFGYYQSNDQPAYIHSVFLLPGAGVTFRTLDRFSAGAAVRLYLGPAFLSNDSDDSVLDDIDRIFLGPQESKTVFYGWSRVSSSVAYSISSKAAVKTRFGMALQPMPLIFWNSMADVLNYPISGNGFYSFFFTLGLTYRL